MIKSFGTQLRRAFYPALRKTDPKSKIVHLTFDDGPDAITTPLILDLLNKKNVKSTFFCIGKKAIREKAIIQRMLHEGHTIGNHSPDHNYWMYKKNKTEILKWIQDGEKILKETGVDTVVGFRSPAGVRTPPMSHALFELKIPLVLWDIRFYDAVLAWTRPKALRASKNIKSGSIVLLHDARKPKDLAVFLDTLDFFIDEVRSRGFEFSPLVRELTYKNIRE